MQHSKCKIIHLITGLNTGGAEMMLYKLLSKMDRQVFEPKVISLTDVGPVGKKIEKLEIPVIGLGMKRGVPNPYFLFKLADILRREKADILQTWMYHADLLGFLAGRLIGQENIVWNIRHSNLDSGVNSLQTRVVARLCARLSAYTKNIICCSQASLISHDRIGYEKSKMIVIPNGFNLEAFKPMNDNRLRDLTQELKLDENVVLVGHVARWDGQKDHPSLIKAASAVIGKLNNVHFVLCGDNINWNNRTLVELLEESNVKSNFHLLGRRDDIASLMPQFDMLVLSSKTGEGFPNVVGEAMSCGVPCVVTDVGDAVEIVGDTGLVVPPGKPEELAKAILTMIQYPAEKRKQLGKMARKRIEQNFSLGVIVDKYQETYLQIMQKGVGSLRK